MKLRWIFPTHKEKQKKKKHYIKTLWMHFIFIHCRVVEEQKKNAKNKCRQHATHARDCVNCILDLLITLSVCGYRTTLTIFSCQWAQHFLCDIWRSPPVHNEYDRTTGFFPGAEWLNFDGNDLKRRYQLLKNKCESKLKCSAAKAMIHLCRPTAD